MTVPLIGQALVGGANVDSVSTSDQGVSSSTGLLGDVLVGGPPFASAAPALLTGRGALEAFIPAGATVTARLGLVPEALKASVVGQASVTARIGASESLSTTVQGQATVTARLGAKAGLRLTVAGSAAVTAALADRVGLRATMTGQAATSATITVTSVPVIRVPLALFAQGRSSMTATIHVRRISNGRPNNIRHIRRSELAVQPVAV